MLISLVFHTFIFHKVVHRCIYGVVECIIITLMQIVCRVHK